MELDIVDQLLICLADQSRNVPLAMRERGYTQEQISEAWTAAVPPVTPNHRDSAEIGSHPLAERGRQRLGRRSRFPIGAGALTV